MTLKGILVALAIGASAVAANAHEVAKGPNGGKVVDIAGHHLEFTHTPSELTIYATDEADKPIATAGGKGRAVIQSGSKTAQLQLAPAEPNRLIAKLDAPLAKGAIVVVSTTFSDGHTAQARFTVD
jgi:hypothetical protein